LRRAVDGVIETMRRLGVKTVVMHNIHGSLPDAKDRRLNHWLDACDKAGIIPLCDPDECEGTSRVL
jgi:hypothetical protein